MWTVLLKEKSEALEKFKSFNTLVEQETHSKLKNLRTDRGGEFTSVEFQAFCDTFGIKRHLTAPYSPQQNRVVERRNRTLLEMTRSILKHMNMPTYLWGEAIRHAAYLINRVATRSLEGKTPYEALKGRKPNISHLKVFGCVCHARTEKAGRRKLDDRSRELVHLGTEPGSKAYRLFDPDNKRIVVSRDIVFEERKAWKWTDVSNMKEFEASGYDLVVRNVGDDEHEYNEEETENDGVDDQYEPDENSASNDDISDDSNDDESHQTQPRRSTRATSKPSYLDDYILIAEIESEHLLMIINDEP